ncbi:hypothetical protein Peur_057211 [Populus x canadensis]
MWFFGWKGPSGFSASSTAEEATQGIDGTGLTAIVTGASSGIGAETTRVLAMRGVHVVMAVRNPVGTSKKQYSRKSPLIRLMLWRVLSSPSKLSQDNIEMLFATNHIVGFLNGQSKLANILHANELARRLKQEGEEITINSLHPGAIHVNLLRHQGFVNGAATTCYVALHPQVKGISGKYFSDSNIAEPSSQAKDAELAKKLWDFSFSITNK